MELFDKEEITIGGGRGVRTSPIPRCPNRKRARGLCLGRPNWKTVGRTIHRTSRTSPPPPVRPQPPLRAAYLYLYLTS
ncbi:unnamed protein product, partial [Nesidiocoris tenuis]